MIKRSMFFLFTIFSLAAFIELSGCAINSRIYNSENACAIFAQHNSIFNNWYRQASNASMHYKIPIPILLATMKAESSFKAYARPRWRKIFGIIPWGHISSAYGYAQALNGTWYEYQKISGHHFASRSSFADSMDFIAWYYRQAVNKAHINPNDAYSLYICYVVGYRAFAAQGAKAASYNIRVKAREVALQAQQYHLQLRHCMEGR